MGLLSKIKSKSTDPTEDDAASTMTYDSTSPLNPSDSTDVPRKKSLYAKYQDLKRGPGLANMTDEDLLKYTGKTREEFNQWKATAPGVAGGQAAGDLRLGHGGLGVSTGGGAGLGGWGFGAGKVPKRDGGDAVVR